MEQNNMNSKFLENRMTPLKNCTCTVEMWICKQFLSNEQLIMVHKCLLRFPFKLSIVAFNSSVLLWIIVFKDASLILVDISCLHNPQQYIQLKQIEQSANSTTWYRIHLLYAVNFCSCTGSSFKVADLHSTNIITK